MSTICESTELGVVIEISRQFGKYTYVRTIGAAASSVVLLVVDRTGQQYAAKVVKREFLIADSNLEYFEREIRLLQFIHHPNIVQLHEILYQTDNIIVIMEFCEQGDLFDHLSHYGPLAFPQLRSFIYQLLKALQFLHEKGFAHRDLKPENILVCSDTIIKVADFGLARPIPPDGMMSTICGSLHYMAPEILQELPYDGMKADIWSFGIIVFAMCLNQLPWASRDHAALAREIVKGKVQCPEHMLKEVVEIVEWCTRRDPKSRPTPTELLAMPWFVDEVKGYSKMFGPTWAVREAASFSGATSVGNGTLSKSTARMIINGRPILRNVPSLDGKMLRKAGGLEVTTS
jgi:serine/threonine protein kinase